MLDFLYFANTLIFNFCIAFYFISALQWYSYKFKRVIFHYHRYFWHVYFLLIPYFIYILSFGFSWASLIYFSLIHTSLLFLWNKKIDKKLVLTNKIKWFFVFVFIYNGIFSLLSLQFSFLFNLACLPISLLSLKIYDFFTNLYFKRQAQAKIMHNENLKIILITASFGKTSMKNFLYDLLKDDFLCYKTPRSVNTLMGIVKDINENLQKNTQIYIAEAGARVKGDILEITRFLNPHICIIGEIGNSHLEYFKSIENIKNTKLEALHSKRLKKAFLHSSTQKKEEGIISIYDDKIINVQASLEGLNFKILFQNKEETFKSQILGSFNAQNLCACILCADFLGVSLNKIKENLEKITSVQHRLCVISKEPKFIIDDGFNGNFKGMSQSYELCKNYQGRKVLITPGILEVNEEENKKLCQVINKCFDLAIISAHVNAEIFKKELKIKTLILKDKNDLIQTLAKETKQGDLILFSNDTPSYL
ncbi:UDP-N-acetylmuramoyl-tripeptide--D-alanyl-D-alanine ligase [Campylobacter sp. VicNov18]|uniref:Mur ligase family protein n=1 Tax=Campylobacter bilis TaxID=2691918 RepID=UPI00130ECB27|nr:UDP-N-acetylmuramoyl-tripeptide--D-alanyl-D-alanine ligase [Campylobacter bilis]MPV63591.1 UDP-N-acetylmuramoyl-tripeptide--D-alanyl-D-alanine ligase [Campylobacter hepaticus]MBM0637091.1 UDP-N-acetylmuramoyl-tripeptide--D-alanyl-D-alanine ligase [Campylobacter bilis]MCC8277751.1 UDP-N-acetylmuramoyl-tripeptide--D-alanyl-D-alanine ligase [Campylobacter bilis]MCC8299360.1 UDP-N-acetylmuramoyl-tripeptide--D-alanyl-D-alanine ligase [Campylobacter bilis]MCC8300660.1 UDP-N-acetylmuramoyl-tripept